MGRAAEFSFWWLRIIAIFGAQIILSASQGPVDVVTKSGEAVSFAYSSNEMSNTSYYSWTIYPRGPRVYQSGDQQTSDPNKYIAINNGSFVLTVREVTKSDARTYCFLSQQMKDPSCANLVVLENLISSVNPTTDLTVGQVVNLTCALDYGGPTTDTNNQKPLSPDQDPQLSMYIGSMEIKDVLPGQQLVGSDWAMHGKSISANRTLDAKDADQSLVCKVTTANPAFSYSSSTFLRIKYATSSAKIIYANANNSTNRTCCQVNDVLNCTANGYPYPTITWKNSAGSDIKPSMSGSGYAAITLTAPGTYLLNCSAKNELSPVSSNATFTVSPAGAQTDPNANPVKGTDNKLALGVGLGVGLGVPVLIGIIVLIVILSRRKKAAKPIAVKQPETGKSPNNGKAPEPGSKNNVNPNPNPTYYTPVMPEQTGTAAPKSVRDSPGYGDLGVRHLGGSGSNPHLNESFDSQVDKSFDSSRNGPSGGNLQFVGGRTSNSPSAPNTSV